MPEVKTFQDLDKLCLEARKYFRNHSLEKHGEIDHVFSLCLDLFKSIGKFKKPEEWKDSREERVLGVLLQTIETILAMYYLSESGFWDNSLALKRNVAELLLIAIATGYDEQCFIDWEYERDCFDEFSKILKRVQESTNVPDVDKSFLPHLKRYWIECSQILSHNIKPGSMRTTPEEGRFRFEPKIAEAGFQEGRLNTIRNMLIDVISISLGVFKYGEVVKHRESEFPEAPTLIAKFNQSMQNEHWKKEETK